MGNLFKNLIAGVSTLIDLGATQARIPQIQVRIPAYPSDAEAMRGDFEAVGNDLRNAMLSVHVEESTALSK